MLHGSTFISKHRHERRPFQTLVDRNGTLLTSSQHSEQGIKIGIKHTHTKTSEPLHQTLNPRNIDKLVVSLKNSSWLHPRREDQPRVLTNFACTRPASVSQQRIGTLIVQHIVQGFIVNLGESTNSVVRFFLLPRFDDNSATQKGEHKGVFFFATSPDQNRTPPTTPTPTRTPRPTISTVEPGNPGYQPCQAQQGGH